MCLVLSKLFETTLGYERKQLDDGRCIAEVCMVGGRQGSWATTQERFCTASEKNEELGQPTSCIMQGQK